LDNGQQVNITIATNEWDVRQTSEWDTVIVQATATLSGKKISIRPGATITTGVNGTATRLRRADYGGLEIYCRDTTTYADVDKFYLRGVRNLTFRRLRTTAVAETKFTILGETANNAAGVTIDQCHVRGVTADANGNYTTSSNYPNNGVDLITTGGSQINSVGSLTITNNLVEWCGSGINIRVSQSGTATSTVSGNEVRYFYDDGIGIAGSGSVASEITYDCVATVSDNVVHDCIGLSTDSANPHTDAIRFIANTIMTADWTINLNRNIYYPGTARGGLACQGVLASDFKKTGVDSGFFFKGTAIGNVVVTRDSTWGIAIENAKAFVALNNTVIKDGAITTGSPVQLAVGQGSTDSTSSGVHRLERNIADVIATGGSPTLTDNITSGTGGATLAYSGTFDGPTFSPVSRANVFTMLDMKAGGPADLGGTYDAGAVGSGAVNWAASNPGGGGSNNVAPADFLVTNDAEFATANTNATAGQIIELQDSGTFTNLTLSNATGITVRGQTSGVPQVTGIFTINGAQNATVTGIKFQPTSAVAANAKLIDLRGNLNGLVIENCYIRYGNPWSSFADFDPTVTDAARMGSSSGWSATNPYNDLPIGIGSGGSGATGPSGNFTIRNNTLLDLGAGVKFTYGSTVSGATPKINGNIIGRCYGDCIAFVIGTASPAITGLEICGNEMFDPFSQPQDNGNPHTDFIQISVPVTWAYPATGWLIAGNIAYLSPGCRGSGQRIFSNGFDVGYPIVGAIVADNVMLSRVATQGVCLGSGDGEGAAWCYVYRNMVIPNPVENVLRQNETQTNSVSGIGPSVISPATIYAFVSSYGQKPNWIAYNTVETITSQSTDRLLGNITTGSSPGTTAAAFSTWLDTDTTGEWNAANSATGAIAALTLKSAYSANRPMTVGESGDTFRSRWSVSGNRPWSSMPSWVAWNDLTGVTTSSTQTSEWSMVHAGQPGGTRAISITGGEYRIADDKDGTNATSWTSSAGNVTSGKFLQVRQTASGSGSTATTLTVTIGSETASWTVTTASTTAYPIVLLDSTTPDVFAPSAAGNLGSNGRQGTFALTRCKFATGNPAAAVSIFTQTGGSGTIQVELITDGKIRVRGRDAAGATLFSVTTSGAMNTGSYFDLLCAWDTNDTTATTGVDLYVDGVSNIIRSTWPATAADIGYSRSITYRIGPAATKDFEIGAIYLNTAARVDITNATNRAKFNADQIGSNGNGPTGSQPYGFWVGTAGQSGGWNDAAGINRGSGSKFIKVASASATDVSGSAWV
jgi:hypothetical protein